MGDLNHDSPMEEAEFQSNPEISEKDQKWLKAIFEKLDIAKSGHLKPDAINKLIFYKSDVGDVFASLLPKFGDYKGKLPGMTCDAFLSYMRYDVERPKMDKWLLQQIEDYELKGKHVLTLHKKLTQEEWNRFYSRQARMQKKNSNAIAEAKMDLLSAELEELQSKPTIGKESARMTRDQLPMSQRVYTVITDHNQLIADTIEAAQHIEEEAIEAAYLPPPQPKPLHEARAYAQHLIDYAGEHDYAVDKMRQKQTALEQAHATFHPHVGKVSRRLALMKRGSQNSDTFERLNGSATESSAQRVKETTLSKSPGRPSSAASPSRGSPENDLRLQMDRLLDRLSDLELRRQRPENRRHTQQRLFDEEKAQLEEKINKTRERLERLARRMSPVASPGSPSPGVASPYDSPDRTLAMLQNDSPVKSPPRANGKAIQTSNRLYYDAHKRNRRKEEMTRTRLLERGMTEAEIMQSQKNHLGPALICTENGWL